MRTFLIIAALLFPLTSGIVSVLLAEPSPEGPVSALAYEPSSTIMARRFDR